MNTNKYEIVQYCNEERSKTFHPEEAKTGGDVFPLVSLLNHLYVLARTRSGKSELLKLLFIMFSYLKNTITIFVDPHGDVSMQLLKKYNDVKDIIFIDLTLKNGFAPTMNPFFLKKKSPENIKRLTQELVLTFGNILGVDFSPNMKVLLIPAISTVISIGGNMEDLIRFFDDDNNEDLIEHGLNNPILPHRLFFKTQFSKSKFKVSKDALETKLQIFLLDPYFYDFTVGENTLNLDKLLTIPDTRIVFRFSSDIQDETKKALIQLVLSKVNYITKRRSKLPIDARIPTFLMCDEYQHFFGNVAESMLSESGKNKLFLVCSHQHLQQLDNKNIDSILSASGIKIVGKNSTKNLAKMATEMDMDVNLLENLSMGEFYVKIGSQAAFKITTTDQYIDDRNQVDRYTHKKIIKYILKKYYRKTADDSNTFAKSTINENNSNDSTLLVPNLEIGE